MLPLQQPLQPREAATVPVPRRLRAARPRPLALHPTPRGPSRPLSPRPWLAKGVHPLALCCHRVPGVRVGAAPLGLTRRQRWCWLRRRTRVSQVRRRCPLRCCFAPRVSRDPDRAAVPHLSNNLSAQFLFLLLALHPLTSPLNSLLLCRAGPSGVPSARAVLALAASRQAQQRQPSAVPDGDGISAFNGQQTPSTAQTTVPPGTS